MTESENSCTEVSDYDEDVIPLHSPLHEYMNMDEIVKCLDKTEDQPINTKESKPSQSSLNIYGKVLNCMCFIITFGYSMLRRINSTLMPSTDAVFNYYLNNKLLKNRNFVSILVSEDLALLSNYESEEELVKRPSMSVFLQQCIQLVGFIMIMIAFEYIVAPYNLADAAYEQEGFHLFWMSIRFLFAFKIPSFVFALLMLMMIHIYLELLSLFFIWNLISENLQQSSTIMKTIKKCLRLVQEAELIARGFTSASIPGIVERLELSTGLPLKNPQRQYPELRKNLCLWTKELILLFREGTDKLLKKSKYDPTKDHASEYLASLDIKELGDFFRYNPKSDSDMQEILKCTDNLSISFLKTMYFLAELQISEFYKCLYFKISFTNNIDSVGQSILRGVQFCSFLKCLLNLNVEEKYIKENTLEVYKYYRSFELSSDPEKKEVATKAQVSPFEINMHTMSLHLKSALKRLMDLEELFDDNQGSNKQKIFLKAENVFKEVKFEINAYEDYYEKCCSALRSILHSEEDRPVTNQILKEVENIDAVAKNIIPCDADPVVEDEIFEAVATKTCPENDYVFQNYSTESQKNKETASKLLLELKNVLVVKAHEHKTREQKALAKKSRDESLTSPLQPSELSNENLTDDHEILAGTLPPSKSSDENSYDFPATNVDASADNNSINALASKETKTFSSFDKNYSLPATAFNASKNTKNPKQELRKKKRRILKKKTTKSFKTDEENSLISDQNLDLKPDSFQFSVQNTSFAASIAALALQRQQMLGITNDVVISDGDPTDEEKQ